MDFEEQLASSPRLEGWDFSRFGERFTEAWAPNVAIARDRLDPLGVSVSEIAADSALPYVDGLFCLVINRHEAFDPGELNRVMRPRATFLTQQVGGKDLQEINEFLGAPPAEYADWSLNAAAQQLTDNGFAIEHAAEARIATRFADVGALVGFLRAVPWQVPDFSVERYRERLRALHDQMEREGPITAQGHRFLVRARRLHPGSRARRSQAMSSARSGVRSS